MFIPISIVCITIVYKCVYHRNTLYKQCTYCGTPAQSASRTIEPPRAPSQSQSQSLFRGEQPPVRALAAVAQLQLDGAIDHRFDLLAFERSALALQAAD